MLRSGEMHVRQRRVQTLDEPVADKPIMRVVKRLDLYPKVHRDHRDKLQKQTTAGAVISGLVVSVMALMFVVEVVGYAMGVDAYHDRLSVDDGIGQKVPINLNITMHNIPCHELHLDAMDSSGEMQMDIMHDLYKSPVDKNGELVFHGTHTYQHTPRDPAATPEPDDLGTGLIGVLNAMLYDAQRDPQSANFCGSCDTLITAPMRSMSATEECCNTCNQVMAWHDKNGKPRPSRDQVEQCIYEASQANPGCNIGGVLVTSKVKGNFHFAPGRSMAMGFKMIHMYSPMAALKFNISHTVHHLSFGDRSIKRFSERGPVVYPLDGLGYTVRSGLAVMKYMLKVLPVFYTTVDDSQVYGDDLESDAPASAHRSLGDDEVEVGASYEFSPTVQTRTFRPGHGSGAPGLFFVYDFYPMQITHIFKRPPFTRFLVDLCKIGGGIFVVTGLLDRLVSCVLRT
eukprot:TRINITY_DN46869_c0_g1_i1.p1 TRINITY_DN46869_c0_g1~~TRINITY_DN46869_c0_g1_i1.p1  ORF type:complete len:483 (+),score=117.07 TRINITY_DN46869_c0_g1_i1:85-1449(+)